MWIQLDDAQAKRLLHIRTKNPIVQYVKDRVRHYQSLDSEVEKKLRAAAKEKSEEGHIEVDDDAVVSVGSDPGAYVMAWLWVYNSEAGLPEDKASEDIMDGAE